MIPDPLHSLFERLFGGTDSADRIAPQHAAQLAAGMEQGEPTKGELSDNPERSTALLASYLDGGMDDATQQDFYARLSQSPALLREVASADAFLDSLQAARATAPADLVATTIARNQPVTVSTRHQRRSFAIWKWSGLAVAVAVAVVAVLVFVGRQSVQTNTTVPVATKADPDNVPGRETPIAGKSQPLQGGTRFPIMAPAASEETTPPSQPPTRPEKQPMAPETREETPIGRRR